MQPERLLRILAVLCCALAAACGDGDDTARLSGALGGQADVDPTTISTEPQPPDSQPSDWGDDEGWEPEEPMDAGLDAATGDAASEDAWLDANCDGSVVSEAGEGDAASPIDASPGAEQDGSSGQDGGGLDATSSVDSDGGPGVDGDADADVDADLGLDADTGVALESDADAADATIVVDATSDGATDGATDGTTPDQELNQLYLAKLRACAYVGPGEFQLRPIEDALGRCVAHCGLQTECPALRRALCREGVENVYQQCVTDCGSLSREGGFVCGALTIWPSWRCNGVNNCKPTGEDEQGCNAYTCRDGQTLTNPFVRCDGKVHCTDRSDEEGCAAVCPEAGVANP